jgi:hypothetical protein
MMRAVFRRWLALLLPASTMALTTVACRGPMAWLNRYVGPRRWKTVPPCRMVGSHLRPPTCQPIRLRVTLFKISLDTVSSIRHAFSRCSQPLPPRCLPTQPPSAPHCLTDRRLRRMQSRLQTLSPWHVVVRSVVLSRPKDMVSPSKLWISCLMRSAMHRRRALVRSVGHQMLVLLMHLWPRGKLQRLRHLSPVLTPTLLLLEVRQPCFQATNMWRSTSSHTCLKVADLAMRHTNSTMLVPLPFPSGRHRLQLRSMSTSSQSLPKDPLDLRSYWVIRSVHIASRILCSVMAKRIAVKARATNATIFSAIRTRARALTA